jgi:Ran GTPase-activating protein (RanGAP) involved in mRNA processing and transport
MLPCYDYFAESIKQNPAMESLKITNHHLPPSPWLENSILSVVETFSKVHGRMTTLELSNCSLSEDDISALTKFLAGNKTITTLNLSRNNISYADSAKALAKAIKKHPVLCNLNLANVSLGGSENIDVLDKILDACKTCESLEIGHEDFDSKCVEMVAKFIGRKNSLTSFSLIGADVDNSNKKLLTNALVKKNNTIEKFSLRSNNLQLPGIIRNTMKITKGLSNLTHLDLSYNSLPVTGAKAMAKFLEADCNLVSLIMTHNRLTTKGANVLLPVLKGNTSLKHLDLSCNWLNDDVAPLVVDLLGNNSALVNFDLSGNKSLRTVREERHQFSWHGGRTTIPRREGGRFVIVKEALLDTTSFKSIASSNHTCALKMSGRNQGDTFEETVRLVGCSRGYRLSSVFVQKCFKLITISFSMQCDHRSMLLKQAKARRFG